MNYFIVNLLVVAINLELIFGEFPSNISRCKTGDVDCMVIVVNELIQTGRQQGHPELNVPPLDPFQWKNPVDIRISDSNSPFRTHIRNTNVSFEGLGDIKVIKIIGFEKDPKNSKFEIYVKSPRIDILSNYKATTHLFLIPVAGHGYSNCSLENFECSFKFYPRIETRNSEEYMLIDKVKVAFNTSRLRMHFDFVKDPLLANAVNLIINENWRDLLEEVRESFENSMAELFQSVLRPLFARIPYKEFFLESDLN